VWIWGSPRNAEITHRTQGADYADVLISHKQFPFVNFGAHWSYGESPSAHVHDRSGEHRAQHHATCHLFKFIACSHDGRLESAANIHFFSRIEHLLMDIRFWKLFNRLISFTNNIAMKITKSLICVINSVHVQKQVRTFAVKRYWIGNNHSNILNGKQEVLQHPRGLLYLPRAKRKAIEKSATCPIHTERQTNWCTNYNV